MLKLLLFFCLLVSPQGGIRSDDRNLFLLDSPGQLPISITFNQEQLIGWKGPQSVNLNIRLERGAKLPEHAVLMFSGVSIDRDFSLLAFRISDYLHDLNAHDMELRLVLPGFHPSIDRPSIHFSFHEPNVDLERLKLFLKVVKLPQLDDVTGVKEIRVYVPGVLNDLLAFQEDAVRFFPSLFDYSLTYGLLILLLVLLPLWTIKSAFYRLQAKFLVSFLLPSLLLFSWFLISNHGFIKETEMNLMNQAKSYLENCTKQLTLAAEDAESDLASNLKTLVSEKTKAFIQDFYEQGEMLEINPWFDRREGVSGHPLDLWLDRTFASLGIQVIFRNDHTSFATAIFHPGHTTRTFHTPVLQKVLKSQLGEYSERYLEEQKANMEITNILRKDLNSVFRDSSAVDSFLYNPWKMFDYMPVAYFSHGFQHSKSFWAYLNDSAGNIWLILGSVDEARVLNTLNDRLLSRLQKMQDQNLHVSMVGHHQTLSQSVKGKVTQFLAHNAAQSWVQRVQSFSVGRDNGELLLSLAVPSPLLPDMTLVVSTSLKSYLQFRQQAFNILYLLILGFCIVLFVLCRWLAQLVLRPLSSLRQGLLKIQSGDLSQDLPKSGADELADLTVRFNQMIQQLREKELVTRFLSNMALQSLHQTDHESIREEVTVLFCAPVAGTDFLDVQQIASFLPKLHQIIHRHGGIVDKFTGFASLSLFRKQSMEGSFILACADIRTLVKNEFPDLQICIGLATGDVVLGHVGASLRKDFTCIGNTVNVAARLQSLPPQAGLATVYLCQRTAMKCQDQLPNLKQLSSVTLKGKTEPVSVFTYL